jgi:hypothetical protein
LLGVVVVMVAVIEGMYQVWLGLLLGMAEEKVVMIMAREVGWVYRVGVGL